MPIKKHINLNLGSFLNPPEKKIVVNLASEDILTLITQELKTHYSPETCSNVRILPIAEKVFTIYSSLYG